MRFNSWVFIAGVVALSLGYFLFNPSYERSLEAKFYYTIGSYAEAERLAKEAFALNPYNRMASTVMVQSQTALRFVRYIEESKRYLDEISKIAASSPIGDAQRAKVRMMCEIMMAQFEKISATVVTDRSLVDEASAYHEKFRLLHDKVAQRP
ncbi:MAG: hypothetical protein JXK05_09310 [Campylobacterales bacterium]|nr:hypothetical protein [Campylobacterales bacterium]